MADLAWAPAIIWSVRIRGLITPETISRAVVPFVLAMVGALLITTYLPFLSTRIQKLLRLY